ALENSTSINGGLTISIRDTTSIAHQTTGGHELSKLEDRRHCVANRECGELLASADQERIGPNNKPAGSQFMQGRKGRVDFAFSAGMDNMEFKSELARRDLRLSRLDFGFQIIRIHQQGHDGAFETTSCISSSFFGPPLSST